MTTTQAVETVTADKAPRMDTSSSFALFSTWSSITTEQKLAMLEHIARNDQHSVLNAAKEVQRDNTEKKDEFDAVLHALRIGQTVEAIKQFRVLRACGLREAKDVIDYVRGGGRIHSVNCSLEDDARIMRELYVC